MLPVSISVLLHIALVATLLFRVLYRRLNVNTTLAWTVVLILLPIAGVVLYVLFGEYRSNRQRRQKNNDVQSHFQDAFNLEGQSATDLSAIPERFRGLATAVHRLTGYPVQPDNTYDILTDARDIIARMTRDIDACTRHCAVEFYIIDAKGEVEKLLQAIERAARRGVDCRILADAYGSAGFFRSAWPSRLRAAGVVVVKSLAVSLLRSVSKRSDLRNHRKLLICDHAVCYTGSFNLIDPTLFKIESNVGQWVDTMLRFEGPAVDAAAVLFNTDYVLETTATNGNDAALDAPPHPGDRDPEPGPGTGTTIQLLPSGPDLARSYVSDFIVTAIFNARSHVRIVSPYFIPDQALMLALTSAASRGITVEIVVPEKVDTRLGQYASQSTFDELLAAGVSIYRYQAGLLHAKMILVDGEVGIFGTVNLDPRSLYLNLEVSLLLYGGAINQDLHDVVSGYMRESEQLDPARWARRPALMRLLENVLRLTAPLL